MPAVSKIASALPKLALLCVIASGGACTVLTAPAAAAWPLNYSFCVKVAESKGAFEDSKCSEEKTGGEYALAYADTATASLRCSAAATETAGFATARCNAKETGDFELKTTSEATPKLDGSGTHTVLSGTIAATKTVVTCTKDTLETQPEAEGRWAKGKLSYSSCTVSEPAHCAVAEPIVSEFTGQLEEAEVEKEQEFQVKLTGAKASEAYAEVEFQNKGESCTVKGKDTLKGSQVCGFDAAISTPELEHETICKTSGSSLTLGTEKATLEETEKLTASSKVAWQGPPNVILAEGNPAFGRVTRPYNMVRTLTFDNEESIDTDTVSLTTTEGARAFSKVTDMCGERIIGGLGRCTVEIRFNPTTGPEKFKATLAMPYEIRRTTRRSEIRVMLSGET
jgi:hypothetical protein